LNPARRDPARRDAPAVLGAMKRLADVRESGLARLTALAGEVNH
jgi:hypothetical protein